jgi:hypothetical protein
MSLPITPTDRVDLGIVSMDQTAVWTEYDYTNADVNTQFQYNIGIISEVFQRTGAANVITSSDASNVSAALLALKNLAVNGLTRSINQTGIQQTFFLTQEMATSLDLLMRSFQAAGSPDPSAGVTVGQLQNWKDLSVVTPDIQNVLAAAVDAGPKNTSLQALVEAQYVQTGNQIIGEKLSSLEQALTTTNGILSTLASLQDIRNRMVVTPPSNAPSLSGTYLSTKFSTTFNHNSHKLSTTFNHFSIFPFIAPVFSQVTVTFPVYSQVTVHPLITLNAAQFQARYNKAASRYFNTAIYPMVLSTLIMYSRLPGSSQLTPIGLTSQGMNILNQLVAIQRSLVADVTLLSGLASPADLTDGNSLYNRIKAVVKNFSQTFGFPVPPTNYSGALTPLINNLAQPNSVLAQSLYRFLLDGNDPRKAFQVKGTIAGDSQQSLTFATTAAQNLNDQQKQSVSSYMFLFEEYYKSASSILQSLTQIIQKMAQNISR